MKTTINMLMTALLVLVLFLALFLNAGCTEQEPEECGFCIDLKGVLRDSMDNTDRAIKVGQGLSIEIGKLNTAVNGLQSKLLKANTEIVEYQKTIDKLKFDNTATTKLANNIVRSLEKKIASLSKPDPNTPPVFGKGDPPAEYIAMFGNDNGARLNFMQIQDLAKIAEAINKQVIALTDFGERVAVLEEPPDTNTNTPPEIKERLGMEDHSKCILDIDGKCCTVKGCKIRNPDEVVHGTD